MKITGTSRALEIGIWHNGKAQTPLYLHPIDLVRSGYWTFRIPGITNPALPFEVRIEFTPEAEIINGYIPCRMWLGDAYGQQFAAGKPALIHTEASDLPMSTVFFCTWMEGEEKPAPGYGVWVVTTRVCDDYRLPPPYEVL